MYKSSYKAILPLIIALAITIQPLRADSPDSYKGGRKGVNFSLLPAVSYGTDLGLQLGA